jgi:ATP-dependent Clp protease ATP-binding subunit ClpA
VIQQRIENALATRILGGEFDTGDHIRVDYAGKSFTFERAPAPTESQHAAT